MQNICERQYRSKSAPPSWRKVFSAHAQLISAEDATLRPFNAEASLCLDRSVLNWELVSSATALAARGGAS